MFVFGQDGFPDFLFSIPGGAPLQRPYSYQKHNAQYPGDSRDGLQQEVFETQSHAEAPVSVRMKDKFVWIILNVSSWSVICRMGLTQMN